MQRRRNAEPQNVETNTHWTGPQALEVCEPVANYCCTRSDGRAAQAELLPLRSLRGRGIRWLATVIHRFVVVNITCRCGAMPCRPSRRSSGWGRHGAGRSGTAAPAAEAAVGAGTAPVEAARRPQPPKQRSGPAGHRARWRGGPSRRSSSSRSGNIKWSLGQRMILSET